MQIWVSQSIYGLRPNAHNSEMGKKDANQAKGMDMGEVALHPIHSAEQGF